MIALWIILGLLALILVLMLIPAGLALHYHGEDFTAEGKWLFLRFTLWPLPEKEEPEKAEKKQEKKAAEKPKKEKKSERRPFMDWLQLINDLLPVLGEVLRKMGKAITLKRCRITMVIAAEEADQTAIRYGRANALLYTIYAFLGRHIRVKEFKAELRQDYLSGPEGESAEADLLVLVCAICFSVHILVIDHFTATCDGVKLSCLQFLFAGTWSTILALFFDTISLQVLLDCIWPLLYVGVFSCGVGYTLQILAQKGSNPTVVTILLSLESVFAVIAGAVVLHQQMTAREYLGCVLMFAAVVLAQIPMPQKKEAKAE